MKSGYSGFTGGHRLQGGWVAAAIGLATSIYGASKAKKQAKEQAKLAQKGIDAADPYAKYRSGDAAKLNALMNDPSSIENTPEFKARMLAASRTMAAQGYTGSGNALVEAANAGGTAYQQAFDNLSLTSGARAVPGGGYDNALQSGQNSNDTLQSGYAAVGGAVGTLANSFNKAAVAPSTGGIGSVEIEKFTS